MVYDSYFESRGFREDSNARISFTCAARAEIRDYARYSSDHRLPVQIIMHFTSVGSNQRNFL